MTQNATVTALPGVQGGLVELTVTRQTACGHSCDGCGRCAGKAPDLVGAAALVYGLPVVLFLLGYLLTGFLPEGLRYVCGGVGFLMGLGLAVAVDRGMKRRASLTYRVVRKL